MFDLLLSLPYSKKLSFETGLVFDSKGYQVEKSIVETDLVAENTFSLYYLDNPLNLKYNVYDKFLKLLL